MLDLLSVQQLVSTAFDARHGGKLRQRKSEKACLHTLWTGSDKASDSCTSGCEGKSTFDGLTTNMSGTMASKADL